MKFIPKLAFGFRQRLPLILQTEAAECGLASMAMVTSYYGHTIDINAIRRKFSASLKGMTLLDLVTLADDLKLLTRAVRVELNELAHLRVPGILHWEFKHFVVLEKITRKGAIIHDPARGRRHVTREELDESFTGVALELWPAPTFRPKVERDQFRLSHLLTRVIGLKRSLAQVFLMALVLEIFAVISPLGMQIVIDQAIVGADYDLVTTVVAGMAVLLFLQIMLGFARSWAVMIVMTRLKVEWEAGMFAHLLRLPLSYFEKRHVGDVVSRFGSLGAIQKTLTSDLVSSVLDGIMTVGALGMMLLYSPLLTAVPVIVALIYVVVRVFFYTQYRQASERNLVYFARRDSHFMESIRGAASIKSLGLEQRRHTMWLNTVIDAMNAGLKTDKLDIVFGSTNTLLFGLGRIAMIWIGAGAVIKGRLTVGMLMAFFSYQDQFTGRVSSLIGMVFQLRMLNLQGERLADIALMQPEEQKTHSGLVTIAENPRLETRGISFRYGDNEEPVFKDLNISFNEGACVALTGPSGCGKTTLLKCLAGLVPPSEGQVLFGGRDIRNIGLSGYRRMTGCVLQDDRLFAGTLADNISGFDPLADQKKIKEAASLAAIDDEICRMPMAYESLVGDMGSSLSGGQKQRIFLARALYRQPRILFLDEATSHLDIGNESLINDAISRLKITRIIVAHRPETIASADEVIMLSKAIR